MDVEYPGLMSGTPGNSGIRRHEDPAAYSSFAPHAYQTYPSPSNVPQMVVNPCDFGGDPSECCVPTTVSLHDLAGVVHPPRGHHSSSIHGMRHDECVSVYGTIRRGCDRAGESGAPPHPRAVGTFLATSHQESAV